MRLAIRPWAAIAAAFAMLMFVSVPLASAADGQKQAARGNGDGPLVRLLDVVNTALAKVNLDDGQKTSTHQIMADAEAQIVALRDDAKAGGAAKGDKDARQALRQKAMAIIKDTRDKLEAVLSADQKVEFRQALKDARAAARDGSKKDGDAPATQPTA